MNSFKLKHTNTNSCGVNKNTPPYIFLFQRIGIHPNSVNLFWWTVTSHKLPSLFIFHPLTCSCNSANLCCLSFSESPLEDAVSEVLALFSEMTAEGRACRAEGAGWRADDGMGTGTGSSGSSGILAKRISNTSCWHRGGWKLTSEPKTTSEQ